MSKFIIRRAKAEDGAALCAIYAPYITDTTITFEYEVPTDAAFSDRIRETAAQFPYLVCERDGEIIGYAYAHRIRERAAYDWDAELSVYLKQGTHGRGIGTVLLACLTMPNPGSVGMQHRVGFEDAGVWHKSGWKFGAWHDVAWFEKHVGGGEPKPVVPFPELDGDNIQKTLNIYTEKLNLEDK